MTSIENCPFCGRAAFDVWPWNTYLTAAMINPLLCLVLLVLIFERRVVRGQIGFSFVADEFDNVPVGVLAFIAFYVKRGF